MFKNLEIKRIAFIFIFLFLITSFGLLSNAKANNPACFIPAAADYLTPGCVSERSTACTNTASPYYSQNACVSLRVSLGECNNPFSSTYSTPSCAEQRLGLSSIQSDTIFIARDPNSLIIVVFRIILYVVITIIVARIVFVGLKITGAGDDADKRKEHFMELVNIIIGLIVAIGALGITFIVEKAVFSDTFNDQIIKCSDLPTNAAQTLKDKCAKNVGTITNSTTSPSSAPKPTRGDCRDALGNKITGILIGSPCPI